MHRSLLSRSIQPLTVGVLLLGGGLAHGQTSTWRGATGGSWFTGTNWTGGLPSASRDAVVNLNRTVAVGSSGARARSLTLSNGGTVSLSGSSATLTVDSWADIGYAGQGTLSLSGGAAATIASLMTGIESTASGTITIDGTGSKLTTTEAPYLGYYGASSVNITNGGHYESQSEDFILGYQNVDTGTTVTVSGAGSRLTTSGWTAVGNFGKASLLVSNGATVSTGDVAIAYGTGDGTAGSIQGAATVTGAGSRWDIDGSLGIGSYSDDMNHNVASMTVAAAGTVQVGAAGDGVVEVVRKSTLRIGDGGTSGTLLAGEIRTSGDIVFNHSDDLDFSVPINDDIYPPYVGTLTKTGTGTLTLSADNTFSGPTAVQAGKLVVNGNLSQSAVTVHTGATLGGDGVIGALTVTEGGILSPGNSVGIIQAGDTLLEGGGIYLWEISSATGDPCIQWDLLFVLGTLDITSTPEDPFTIAIASLDLAGDPGAAADFDPAQTYTWIIATTTGGIDGFDADRFAIDATGFANAPYANRFSLSSDGTNLLLTYSAVPEPAAWGILGAIGLLAIALQKRRRRNR